MNNRAKENRDMLPLGLLTSGETAEIVEAFSDSCKSAHTESARHGARVEDMGIRAGSTVEMLNNAGRGPILLKVDGARIAIGRGIAMRIFVRRNES